MSQTREIVTLQIGQYSNFIGTHWWNTQESSFCYSEDSIQPVNHDVLFREGENYRRETTFTPRLIAIDLKGSLNTLRQEGMLYEVPVPAKKFNRYSWNGKVDVHKAPTAKKNEFLEDLEKQDLMLHPELESIDSFDEDKDICIESTSSGTSLGGNGSALSQKDYDLDSNVTVWSDYLRTHLHPRSVFLLPDYTHNDDQDPFDLFGCGLQSYQIEQNRDDIEEKIRQFTEECDFLQGFNIIVDGFDGFAGLAANIQQHLKDEYTNKIQFCIPVYKPLYKINKPVQAEAVHRLFTTLFCFDAMAQYSSFFSPLNVGTRLVEASQAAIGFPHLTYKSFLSYHTSAILSSVIEMLTLPARLKKNAISMLDMAQHLVCVGRKLLVSSLCLPLCIPKDGYLSDIDSHSLCIVPQVVTPFCDTGHHSAHVQSFVFCGIDNRRIFSPNYPSYQKVPVEELVGRHLNTSFPSSLSTVTVLQSYFKAAPPFPNIFSDHVVSYGPNKNKMAVKELPVAAGLQNTDSASVLLREVTQAAAKINFRKFHRCLETGTEMDDITETIDNLTSFTQNYCDPNRIDS